MAARKAPEKGAENDAPDPEPLPGSGLGQVAYEAYVKAVGDELVTETASTWDQQVRDSRNIAAAWCAAAQAVITATIQRSN